MYYRFDIYYKVANAISNMTVTSPVSKSMPVEFVCYVVIHRQTYFLGLISAQANQFLRITDRLFILKTIIHLFLKYRLYG